MLVELLEDRRLLASDFGDAPEPYPTLIADNGAEHALSEISPYLGRQSPDFEDDGIPNESALGDDLDQSDDEDGLDDTSRVLIPGNNTILSLRQGRVGGLLNAWIDFNRDGDWDDEDEQIATNVEVGDQGFVQSINFDVPQDAVDGPTYGRFRISTAADLQPTGVAPDGEVEDYSFVIAALDYGDAPDTYRTAYASDGARHSLLGRPGSEGGTLALGTLIDGEVDGFPGPNADGDDNDGLDDEDGITGLDQPLLQGNSYELGVTLTFPETLPNAILFGWVDFNGDDDFNDEGENPIFEFVDASTRSVSLSIPEDAESGKTYARFRLSTETLLGPDGFAIDGEVEDYLITIGEEACSLEVTTTEDSLDAGTLRSAIICANTTPNIDRNGDGIPDPDPITFNIPGSGPHKIEPLSGLPTITDALHLDGTTQPGFIGVPLIEIDGNQAGTGPVGTGANAFVLVGGAGRSIVESLVINRFSGRAIEIADADGGHQIIGNFIGTDVTGASAAANGGPDLSGAIYIGSDASGNTIAQNLVSGNHNIGMLIGSDGNVIEENLIGTDASGMLDVGNGSDGLMLLGSGNVVLANAVSGNEGNGMTIQEGGENNLVVGNVIGTDVTGALDLGNSARGILLNGANNTVGGLDEEDRNLISGNGESGIGVGNDNNLIIGNLIGTNVDGTGAIANLHGVFVFTGSDNEIEGNVISGNTQYGVQIFGDDTTGNRVSGNLIGTDRSGVLAVPNFNGVLVSGPSNVIGVDASGTGAGNLISGNTASGVNLSGAASTSNTVAGNAIGTDLTGEAALGNGSFGLFISNQSSGNTIGGMTPQAANLISGNAGGGIGMQGTDVTGNVVQGNLIGTTVNGTAKLGNGGTGVLVIGTGNTIGGSDPSAGNVIGDNINGVELVRSDNLVWNNWIGTDKSGTIDLGNRGPGVFLNDGSGNQILENVIAFNGIFGGGTGVASLPRADGNPILSNSIYSNEGLGIDLGDDGVTPNDELDPDTGANNLQNFPVLDAAISSGANTVVAGSLNSLPDASFLLQFFSSEAVDPSGFGEGRTLLGQTQVITDAEGDASFDLELAVALSGGTFVTATATLVREQSFVETSEFSAAIPVSAVGPVILATKDDRLEVDQDGDGKADPGDVIAYTIRIENDGDFNANDVVLEDEIDSNTELIEDSILVTPLALDDAYMPELGSPIVVPATLGLLANDFDVDGSVPGTNEDLTVVLDEVVRLGGSLSGILEVNLDGSFTYTPPVDQAGNEIFAYNVVDADGLNAVVAGFVTFTVQGDGVPVELDELRPSKVDQPVSTAPESQSVSVRQLDGTLTIAIPVIPPGKVAELEFQSLVNSELPPDLEFISNQAVIMGSNFLTVLSSDPDTPEIGDPTLTPADPPSVPEADLSITKTSDELAPSVGDEIVFTIQVSNAGPDPATGVRVTDKLPEGLGFVESVPSIGEYEASSGVWTIGQIDVGESETLQIVAEVLVGQSITNVAEITARDQLDPNPDNDRSSVVIGQCLTGGPLVVGKNEFTYSCVTPGGFAKFLVGTETGLTFIERWGVTVGIANPISIAIGVGDPSGIARGVVHITEEQLAQDLIFQAYEMVPEPKVSNRLFFPSEDFDSFDDERLDINRDDSVTALDALLIINQLSARESNVAAGESPVGSLSQVSMDYDANGDGMVSALDALRVINYLGRSKELIEANVQRVAHLDAAFVNLGESAFDEEEIDDELIRLLIEETSSVA